MDARLNVVESCCAAPADSPAIVYQSEGGEMGRVNVGELKRLADRVAGNLMRAVSSPASAGDHHADDGRSGGDLSWHRKAGCVVVGIADSFRPKEIAARLRLAGAAAVFTQDVMTRGGKSLPLYASVKEADALPAIVVAEMGSQTSPLAPAIAPGGNFWNTPTARLPREPEDHLNILFSSGTTGEPKAIPWTHTTPIKCAADAHFHQNVKPGDVLVWPTNLGWMMGPWLIFASLINRATMGLYYGAPTGRDFGRFVQDSKTTMLGVVPSLVKTWRNSGVCRNSIGAPSKCSAPPASTPAPTTCDG